MFRGDLQGGARVSMSRNSLTGKENPSAPGGARCAQATGMRAQATRAYVAGNKALARELGARGREHGERMRAEHQAAAARIFDARNSAHRGARARPRPPWGSRRASCTQSRRCSASLEANCAAGARSRTRATNRGMRCCVTRRQPSAAPAAPLRCGQRPAVWRLSLFPRARRRRRARPGGRGPAWPARGRGAGCAGRRARAPGGRGRRRAPRAHPGRHRPPLQGAGAPLIGA